MSERFWPTFNKYNEAASMSHISRYLLARGFIQPWERVVDVACGNGYGSYLLSKTADVVAVDKDAVFEERYKRPDSLTFMQETIEGLPDIQCDTVVSLETIEHLADPRILLDWVNRNATRKFIVSSPNIPSVGKNPHHLSNVEFSTLQELMKGYPDWTLYQVFYQDVYYIAIYVRKDTQLLKP